MIKFLWIIGLSGLSAALYAISGKGGFKGAKLLRRLGISLLCYIPACFILFGLNGWYLYILSAGLLSFALTTYHDYLAPDGSSENWLCWLVTGGVYSLASIPLYWAGVYWWAIGLRTIILALITMAWSEAIGYDRLEEIGRGAFIILTMPIFLL